MNAEKKKAKKTKEVIINKGVQTKPKGWKLLKRGGSYYAIVKQKRLHLSLSLNVRKILGMVRKLKVK